MYLNSPEASGVLYPCVAPPSRGRKCPVSPLVLGSVATQELGGLSNLCLRRAERRNFHSCTKMVSLFSWPPPLSVFFARQLTLTLRHPAPLLPAWAFVFAAFLCLSRSPPMYLPVRCCRPPIPPPLPPHPQEVVEAWRKVVEGDSGRNLWFRGAAKFYASLLVS